MTFSKKTAFIVSCAALLSTSVLAADKMDEKTLVAEGKKVFVTKSLGNCLGCHSVENDPDIPQTGNIGPHLKDIGRYPKEWLFAQIWNPNQHNPNTIMPPLGRNHKITKEQIDAVITYLQVTTKTK